MQVIKDAWCCVKTNLQDIIRITQLQCNAVTMLLLLRYHAGNTTLIAGFPRSNRGSQSSGRKFQKLGHNKKQKYSCISHITTRTQEAFKHDYTPTPQARTYQRRQCRNTQEPMGEKVYFLPTLTPCIEVLADRKREQEPGSFDIL